MPLSHTWMRNIHWTNMKEKYICPVHPVKRGLCLIISFLILGICFLSARAATGEISDHTGAANREFHKGIPQVKEEQIQHSWDWMQILILIQVCPTFIISATNLFISYKRNHRKQHDPEAGPRLEEHRPLLEEHSIIDFESETSQSLGLIYKAAENPQLQIKSTRGDLQETMSDLQEKLNQLQNERVELRIHNGQLTNDNNQLQNERGDLQEKLNQLQNELDQLKSENKKLQHENEWRKARNKTDNITLDAGTAHPNLSISGDQKSLKHEAQPQKVPPNPERFDSTVCVLGSEGFSIGKHYWEVDVVSSTDWDLGVAIKSIQRKGKLSLSPKEGFWALGQSGRDYWAKTDPWTRVMVQKKPKKIGVYLSYPEGRVTFFNVTDMSVLVTFNDCSFSEEIYPFFKNSHKETIMRISSIKEED